VVGYLGAWNLKLCTSLAQRFLSATTAGRVFSRLPFSPSAPALRSFSEAGSFTTFVFKIVFVLIRVIRGKDLFASIRFHSRLKFLDRSELRVLRGYLNNFHVIQILTVRFLKPAQRP
jgi:hypothetical protein